MYLVVGGNKKYAFTMKWLPNSSKAIYCQLFIVAASESCQKPCCMTNYILGTYSHNPSVLHPMVACCTKPSSLKQIISLKN